MTKRISYKKKYEASQAELEAQRQKLAELELQLELLVTEAKGQEGVRQVLEQQIADYRERLEKTKTPTRQFPILEVLIAGVGLLVAILVWVQVQLQTEHMGVQTQHMQKQTDYIGNQNEILLRQEGLIDSQNVLFGQQNMSILSQLRLDSVQNRYILNQNQLFRDQNQQIATQISLDSTQNLLFQEQNTSIASQLRMDSAQVDLMKEQSDKIDVQIELLESDRRSSLVIMMGNIMDQINLELDGKEKKEDRVLKQETISRIIALSHALKPYIYLENGKPIEKPLSPERGQLLLALGNLGLSKETYDKIYEKAVFEFADLKRAPMRMLYLVRVNLRGANLKRVNLIQSNLQRVNLNSANLESADLWNANLESADLKYSNLREVKLINANLANADMSNTNLVNADMRNANIDNADVSNSDLSYADLRGVKGVSEINFNKKNLYDFDYIDGMVYASGFLEDIILDDCRGIKVILDSAKIERNAWLGLDSAKIERNAWYNQQEDTIAYADVIRYYYRLEPVWYYTFKSTGGGATLDKQIDHYYILPRYPGLLQKRKKACFEKMNSR